MEDNLRLVDRKLYEVKFSREELNRFAVYLGNSMSEFNGGRYTNLPEDFLIELLDKYKYSARINRLRGYSSPNIFENMKGTEMYGIDKNNNAWPIYSEIEIITAMMEVPFEELPLYINTNSGIANIVISWRMKEGK